MSYFAADLPCGYHAIKFRVYTIEAPPDGCNL